MTGTLPQAGPTTGPAVGGEWSSYDVAHRVGHVAPTGWTPACDMRMVKWPLRAHAPEAQPPTMRPARSDDRRCTYCAAGIQRT